MVPPHIIENVNVVNRIWGGQLTEKISDVIKNVERNKMIKKYKI